MEIKSHKIGKSHVVFLSNTRGSYHLSDTGGDPDSDMKIDIKETLMSNFCQIKSLIRYKDITRNVKNKSHLTTMSEVSTFKNNLNHDQ